MSRYVTGCSIDFSHIFCSLELDEKTILQVWKMAKAFGENHKVLSWIFYFEVSFHDILAVNILNT